MSINKLPILNYEKYLITTDGVITNQKGDIIKPSFRKNGEAQVNLTNDVGRHTVLVKRLMMSTFSGEVNKTRIVHIDGNKQNNSLSNLRYSTGQDDIIKRRSRRHQRNPVQIEETGELYKSESECASDIQGSVQGVSDCVTGKTEMYKGYHIYYTS